jgi:hypothetical protein
MANAGRILILPKGEYDASKTYEMLDLVNRNGISWLAKKTVSGIAPVEGEYWQPLLGIDIANNLETSVEGKVLDARQGKALSESIDLKGRFQTFKKNYIAETSGVEAGEDIVFDELEGQTLQMFDIVNGQYVAKEDMTVYVKATVYAHTDEELTNRVYATLMYTPVGGSEARWLEDASYGPYASITMSGVKQVKKGDKFRIRNLEKVYLNAGFLCRPSGIEFIHM